jgi:hypothetical protein
MAIGLTAYLDDSGTDAANPFLIVGGFAADADQWSRFNEEVARLDREFQAPPFHAKVFEKARHGHGFYVAWIQEKRKEYLNRFLGIMTRRTFKSFGTLLDAAVYEKIIRPHKAFQEYFYSPFAFAAVNSIHAVCEWRNTFYPGETLRLVFDRGNKNEGQLKEIAKRAFIGFAEENVADISMGDDEHLPPLRAADILAYELCAEGRNAQAGITRSADMPCLNWISNLTIG